MTEAAPPKALAADRVMTVDALRGFALFGILVVNITAFSTTYQGSGLPNPTVSSSFDRAVLFVISLIFEGKFYLLFSFLFGYSFTLQMRSTEQAGETLKPRILRRQLELFLIGALHAVFLFYGDILITYAAFGLILLWLRNRSDSSLLRIACWVTGVFAVFWGLLGILTINFIDPAQITTSMETVQQELAAYRGTIGTVIHQNLSDLAFALPTVALLQGPFALAMFLVGCVAGRRQLLAQPEPFQKLIRPLLLLGLFVGLPGALVYAYTANFTSSAHTVIGVAIVAISAPFLTGAYIVIAMLAFRTSQRLTNLLAAAGRMALSNYVLQSLICCVIFTAYGLRLMNEFSSPAVFAIVIAIFVLQLEISRLWLARFAYGPLEWLLRALTNAAWPQWRRETVSA